MLGHQTPRKIYLGEAEMNGNLITLDKDQMALCCERIFVYVFFVRSVVEIGS